MRRGTGSSSQSVCLREGEERASWRQRRARICARLFTARAPSLAVLFAVSFPLQHREQLCVRQDLVVDRQALLSVISSASSEVCVCVWRTKRGVSAGVGTHHQAAVYARTCTVVIVAVPLMLQLIHMNAHDVTARGPMLHI